MERAEDAYSAKLSGQSKMLKVAVGGRFLEKSRGGEQTRYVQSKKMPFVVLTNVLWNRWSCCPISTLCGYKVVRQ